MGGTLIRGRGRVAVAAAAVLAVPATALAIAVDGPTELVSIGPTGQDPVTERGPAAVDASGRHVAFSSAGRDLDPSDGNVHEDVFVRDRVTGDYERVSLADGGGDANGPSTTSTASLSADAQRVAFASRATNLVASDNNMRQDVFLRDRAGDSTQLLSRNFAGLDANGSASEPAISADGGTFAFTSDATDMTVVPDLDGHSDVYARSLEGGSTVRVSETPAGLPGNGPSSQPALSADGTKVAFVSRASDLVAGDTNGRADVFVRDLSSGETTRLSVASSEAQSNGDSTDAFISPDGRYVGFSTLASNLGGVKYTNSSSYELYVRDTATATTERISMRVIAHEGDLYSLELSSGSSRRGRFSADGRLVAFDSTSSQLVQPDTGNTDVFVLDRAEDRMHILSRTPQDTPSNGGSFSPVVAEDGVAFRSNATNLASPGGAFSNQVFFRPFVPNDGGADIDGDGVPSIEDVCPLRVDPDQADTDGEGRGDACDGDDDSDTIADPFEAAQASDPRKVDTDGDGAGDLPDDHPNDSSRQVGTEHQRLNVADLDSQEGEAVAKLLWNEGPKTFDARVTGVLRPNTTYTVVGYRRHPAIRLQTICTATTNGAGALSCTRGGQRLTYFTHVELRRGSTVISTAACDDPDSVVGERRCDLLQ